MHLVEVLLPTGSSHLLEAVRVELTEHFGGVTAFSRAPALGLWRDTEGTVQRDDIVVMEIMVPRLDRAWWHAYRRELQRRFAQRDVVVRAAKVQRL